MKALEYVLGSTEDLRSDVVRFIRQLRRLDERVEFHLLCLRYLTEDRVHMREQAGRGPHHLSSKHNTAAKMGLPSSAPSVLTSTTTNPMVSSSSSSLPVSTTSTSGTHSGRTTRARGSLPSSRGGIARRVTTRAATRQAMDAMMAMRRGGTGSDGNVGGGPYALPAFSSPSGTETTAAVPSSAEEVEMARKRRRMELCAALREAEDRVDPVWRGATLPGLPLVEEVERNPAVLQELFEEHRRFLQRYLAERDVLASELVAVATRIHSIAMGERAIG